MPGTDPILVLANASIRAVTMPAILPAQPYNQLAAPSYYGAIAVRDHASIGTIALGAYANLDRAPPPYGHGPLTAPDSLTVNLAPGAQLAAGFDVQWGSTLVVDGSGHSAFHATSGTLEGGNATIAAALLGPGTITLTHGPTDYTGYASVGTLDLGRVVGPGETIDISMGILQIDRPLEFHGTIDIAPSENPAGGGSGYQSYGPQMVTLEGLTATSYNFDDSRTSSLYQGDSVVDRVAFTPDGIGASFGSAMTTRSGSRSHRKAWSCAGNSELSAMLGIASAPRIGLSRPDNDFATLSRRRSPVTGSTGSETSWAECSR